MKNKILCCIFYFFIKRKINISILKNININICNNTSNLIVNDK